MIVFQPLKTTMEYRKETYSEFISQTFNMFNNIEDLGLSSDGENHIYGVYTNNLDIKPTIFLNACIHGDEWESSYWLREFIKYIKYPSLAEPTTQKYFIELGVNYSFYAIFILNPYGFNRDIRYTINGVDLNRQYNNNNFPEINAIKQKVVTLSPLAFIDNHSSHYSYEAVGVGGVSGTDLFYMVNDLLKSLKHIRGHYNVDWYTMSPSQDSQEVGRGWASIQNSIRGGKVLPILLEASRTGTLGSNRNKIEFGLNGLLLSCLYLHRYFEKNIIK